VGGGLRGASAEQDAHRRPVGELVFEGSWLVFGDKFHRADRPCAHAAALRDGLWIDSESSAPMLLLDCELPSSFRPWTVYLEDRLPPPPAPTEEPVGSAGTRAFSGRTSWRAQGMNETDSFIHFKGLRKSHWCIQKNKSDCPLNFAVSSACFVRGLNCGSFWNCLPQGDCAVSRSAAR